MIKAATTHYDVASSGTVQKAIPALDYLASLIGDRPVRHRGTIGGSLANTIPRPTTRRRCWRSCHRENQQAFDIGG